MEGKMANGTYTNSELIDTIVVDMNNMIKEALTGQYVQICYIVTAMTQKLMNLKKGIEADLTSKDKVIEQLKDQLRAACAEVEDMTPEQFIEKYGKKDGAE
jgi:hypothetical protein